MLWSVFKMFRSLRPAPPTKHAHTHPKMSFFLSVQAYVWRTDNIEKGLTENIKPCSKKKVWINISAQHFSSTFQPLTSLKFKFIIIIFLNIFYTNEHYVNMLYVYNNLTATTDISTLYSLIIWKKTPNESVLERLKHMPCRSWCKSVKYRPEVPDLCPLSFKTLKRVEHCWNCILSCKLRLRYPISCPREGKKKTRPLLWYFFLGPMNSSNLLKTTVLLSARHVLIFTLTSCGHMA